MKSFLIVITLFIFSSCANLFHVYTKDAITGEIQCFALTNTTTRNVDVGFTKVRKCDGGYERIYLSIRMIIRDYEPGLKGVNIKFEDGEVLNWRDEDVDYKDTECSEYGCKDSTFEKIINKKIVALKLDVYDMVVRDKHAIKIMEKAQRFKDNYKCPCE